MAVFVDGLSARRRLDAVPGLELPPGVALQGLLIGRDSQEALIVGVEGGGSSILRQIHKGRLGQRNVPLVVVAVGATGVAILGPGSDGEAVVLTLEHAQRVTQAVLDQPSATAARTRLASIVGSLQRSGDLPGVDNTNLFATYYLENHARRGSVWVAAGSKAQQLLHKRGEDLIKALGFSADSVGDGARLLTPTDGPARAIAVLLGESEGFEATTSRLGSSPIQYGLAKATQQRVPWLMILRGTQIRLYAVRPDIGLSSRSQTETYFELDLAIVDDRTAGFLPLVFSADALIENGSVDTFVADSLRYATALGERLRDRVYNKVVPALAVAVAGELERIDPQASLDDAYRITLKILFRLLFQAYAEDQGLLPYGRNDRYTRNALTTQTGDFLTDPDRALSPESHAIWDDLQQVWDVIDTGNESWGVPAYNGGLFGRDSTLHPDGSVISQMKLSDRAVGTALRHLLTDETPDGGVGAVDFGSLSVREFGTIYEGLLESSLSRASQDLVVDEKDQYLPAGEGDEPVVRMGDVYHHNSSGQRKATGSYFTRKFAVEYLLDSALEPALDDHLGAVADLIENGRLAEATTKFFDFRIADLAMGSGHFLVAAIDRIEGKMAAFLVDHPIPRVQEELDRLEQAARSALGSSADELPIEQATLLRRQIARRCVYGLDVNEIAVELSRVAIWIHTFVPGLPMSTLDHNLVCANSLTGVATIGEALDALEPRWRRTGQPSLIGAQIEQELERARDLLIDAANLSEATKAETVDAAAKHREAMERAKRARLLMDAAVAMRLGLIEPAAATVDELVGLASESTVQEELMSLQVGHLPYLFPEVMEGNGGFHVLLGNPPWDELHHNADKFWVRYFAGHMAKPSDERTRLRERYAVERPDLAELFELERAQFDALRKAVLASPAPMGTGADLFVAFCWRYLDVVASGGRVGVVLPRGATVGAAQRRWREVAQDAGSITDVMHLVNKNGWVFEDTEERSQIVLLTWVSGLTAEPLASRGFVRSPEEFAEASRGDGLAIGASTLSRLPGLAIPAMPAPGTEEIVNRFLVLPTLADSPIATRVGHDGIARVVREAKHVPADSGGALGVLQGRHVGLFESRPATEWIRIDGDVAYREKPGLAFRQIARADDSRTFIVGVVPARSFIKETAYFLCAEPRDAEFELFLLGYLGSRVFDWFVRTLVDRRVLPSLAVSLPVPQFDRSDPAHRRVIDCALRLLPPGDMADWYRRDGSERTPNERSKAAAALDGAVAAVLGMTPPELDILLQTFHPTWLDTTHFELARDVLLSGSDHA